MTRSSVSCNRNISVELNSIGEHNYGNISNKIIFTSCLSLVIICIFRNLNFNGTNLLKRADKLFV